MLDQSHNVTDPLESLMTSAIEVVRAFVQAHLVDRAALAEAQETQRRRSRAADAEAGVHDRRLADPRDGARMRAGGAIDPVAAYRASGYRDAVARERPASGAGGSAIVDAGGGSASGTAASSALRARLLFGCAERAAASPRAACQRSPPAQPSGRSGRVVAAHGDGAGQRGAAVGDRRRGSPAAMACTSTLPAAVASTGPASTGLPVASAVAWFR